MTSQQPRHLPPAPQLQRWSSRLLIKRVLWPQVPYWIRLKVLTFMQMSHSGLNHMHNQKTTMDCYNYTGPLSRKSSLWLKTYINGLIFQGPSNDRKETSREEGLSQTPPLFFRDDSAHSRTHLACHSLRRLWRVLSEPRMAVKVSFLRPMGNSSLRTSRSTAFV